MTRLLSWIVMVPIALAVAVFAANNRGIVVLNLWPFPYVTELPVYLAVLIAGFAGFGWGVLACWLGGRGVRKRARVLRSRLSASEREAAGLRDLAVRNGAEAR